MKTWGAAVLLSVWSGAAKASFDAALVRAVGELEEGALLLVITVSYLLGLALLVAGLLRLKQSSEDTLRGPRGGGTAVCFVGGMVLLSFPAWLEAGAQTLFGADAVTSLSYSGGGADTERYQQMLTALLAIVQFVGLIGFVKGWFVLKAAGDGYARGTFSSGSWHIVGGLLCWHIKPVIHAVQETIGVELLSAS